MRSGGAEVNCRRPERPGTRTLYEPYGMPLTTPPDGAPSYTGHQYDTGTGLIYAQQRYYDPQLGVFMSPDPMAVDTTSAFNFNRYAYANNSPYKFSDPDGRQSKRRDGGRFAELGLLIAEKSGLISPEAAEGIRAGVTDGKVQPTRKPRAGSTRADGIRGEAQKRGPKTDPSAPHNATIRSEADRLESEGNQILAGGGRERERLVPTPGGEKSGRRPDILYQTPEGDVRATNVGRTNADGTPVKREVSAMNDLNQAGVPTDFIPYDR